MVLGVFIAALVLSGLTAFPLLHELELLARFLGIAPDAAPASLGSIFTASPKRDDAVVRSLRRSAR